MKLTTRNARWARPFAMLALACGILIIGGCRAAALREVKVMAAQYDEHLQSTPSRVEVSNADAYLERIATEIRDACQAIDERRVSDAIDEAEQKPELDFYDKFNFYLVHSPAPNAATPGDDCAFITSRMFLEAEKPEHIYAIAAHEFGHIRNLHQVDQVERRLTHQLTVAVVSGIGATADAYASANNPYHQQLNWGRIANNAMRAYVPWRKADEFEADLTGLEIYLELGLDPEEYVSLFELMRERWGDGGGQSHPSTTERIERIEEALSQKSRTRTDRNLDGWEFRSIQTNVARELEKQQQLGNLVAEEIAMVERLSSGVLTSRISCCGPTEFDSEEMLEGYEEILERRKRGRR